MFRYWRLPGSPAAQNSKFSAELQNMSASAPVNVIVQYNHVPTAADHVRTRGANGVFRGHLPAVAGGAYTLSASSLNSVANDASVTHISVDHALQARLDYATAATNASITQTWGIIGTGVGVAVIDSGIAPNSDFGNRVVLNVDFTGGNGIDLFGHGTHVAGIIGGNGANSQCSSCNRALRGWRRAPR